MFAELDYIFSLNVIIAILMLLMLIEYLVVLIIQGGKSLKGGTKPKEDQIPGGSSPNPTENDKEADERWRRIVSNHLETIPFVFLLFLISVFVAHSSGNGDARLALLILIILYVFFRYLYTICYAFAIQPFRSMFWFCSILCALGGGLVGVVAAFYNVQNSNPLTP